MEAAHSKAQSTDYAGVPILQLKYLLTCSPNVGASVSKSDGSDEGYKLSAPGIPPADPVLFCLCFATT